MKPLKKLIPNNEDFFNHQFDVDSFKKMAVLYSSDIDELVWTELRMRFWPNSALKQIIDQGKLNEAIKNRR